MIGFMTHLDTFLDEYMSEFYGKQRFSVSCYPILNFCVDFTHQLLCCVPNSSQANAQTDKAPGANDVIGQTVGPFFNL